MLSHQRKRGVQLVTRPMELRISFSGINIRFDIPDEAELGEDLTALECGGCSSPDFEFEIGKISVPYKTEETAVGEQGGMREYVTDCGRVRVYSALRSVDGCEAVCVLRNDGKNTLLYPAARWDFYSRPLRLLHLIAPELLLLRKEAFLLHSSVVEYGGRAVLFAGRPGIGKSTQAALWQKHMGADIINGDRCVIMKRNGVFFGGGSPWCGTSGIRRSEQYPISGIVLPYKSPVNKIERIGGSAFPALLSQTLTNSWNAEMTCKITALYSELLRDIPVYRLDCRPDEEAVRITYREIFGQ